MPPALALVTPDSDTLKSRVRARAKRAEAGPPDGTALPVTPPALGAMPSNAVLSQHDERELVNAAQHGNADAFSALVRAHQRRAYSVARAITANHEDAEDAVQEGFLHAYRALDRFLLGQPFGAWLHRIVANAALDLTRRRRVREADALPDSLAAGPYDPGEASDLRGRLYAGLATLSIRQRAVIVLHDIQGFRHGEISRMLGIPDGTARSDLFHARLTLRNALRALREVR